MFSILVECTLFYQDLARNTSYTFTCLQFLFNTSLTQLSRMLDIFIT
jgi:hypothetical protein